MPATLIDRLSPRAAFALPDGERLDTPIRRVMTPGVVTIVEDASLGQVHRAMLAHGVHAVLVVGRTDGKPLGWVTSRGLLDWVTRDISLACARDAVNEKVVTVEPGATVREAAEALIKDGTTHLLVCHQTDWLSEGVVSDINLIAWARE